MELKKKKKNISDQDSNTSSQGIIWHGVEWIPEVQETNQSATEAGQQWDEGPGALGWSRKNRKEHISKTLKKGEKQSKRLLLSFDLWLSKLGFATEIRSTKENTFFFFFNDNKFGLQYGSMWGNSTTPNKDAQQTVEDKTMKFRKNKDRKTNMAVIQVHFWKL